MLGPRLSNLPSEVKFRVELQPVSFAQVKEGKSERRRRAFRSASVL